MWGAGCSLLAAGWVVVQVSSILQMRHYTLVIGMPGAGVGASKTAYHGPALPPKLELRGMPGDW